MTVAAVKEMLSQFDDDDKRLFNSKQNQWQKKQKENIKTAGIYDYEWQW